MTTFTARHERRTCRRCGGHYMTGEYRDHVRSLAHRREIERRPASSRTASTDNLELTLNQAAAVLGLEQSTLRRQIARGSLRARKVGPLWVVTVDELDRYRAEHLGRAGGRKESK